MGKGAPRASMGAGNGGSQEEATDAPQRERTASAKASWFKGSRGPQESDSVLGNGCKGCLVRKQEGSGGRARPYEGCGDLAFVPKATRP